MPQYGQLVFLLLADPPDSLHARVGEPDEMKDQRVDDLERQGVFLVEQDTDEERVGSGVFHVTQSEEGGGGVQYGNGDLGQDRGDDRGFPECTSSLRS